MTLTVPVTYNQETLDGLLRLYEALTVDYTNKLLKKPVAALQTATGAFFMAQGTAYLKALAAKQSEFSEALTGDSLDSLFDRVTAKINTAFATQLVEMVSGRILASASAAISLYKLGIAFNLTDPIVVEFLKNYGADRVTQINDTTKATLRTIITDGIEAGQSYKSISATIKQTFSTFADKVKGPSHIRSRAELVAVTEIANAHSFGGYAAVQTAKQSGLKFEKEWITSGDKRVSDGCKENANDGWISLDSEHSSGNLYPPRFPGCRCVEGYRRV